MPPGDRPAPIRKRWFRPTLMWFGIFVAAVAAALIAPMVVSVLDFRLVHQGRHMPDRAFAVTDASGATIGHGYRYWSHTIINVGHLQTGLAWLNGSTRPLPSWAQVSPPAPFTAIGTLALGWPARWQVSTTLIDYNATNAAQRMQDEPSTMLWLPLLANIVFFVAALLIVGQMVEIARRLRGCLRRRKNRCSRCGYDLTALRTARCPECGHDAERRSSPAPANVILDRH